MGFETALAVGILATTAASTTAVVSSSRASRKIPKPSVVSPLTGQPPGQAGKPAAPISVPVVKAQEEQKTAVRRRKRVPNVLTGPRGLQEEANIFRKKVLGTEV